MAETVVLRECLALALGVALDRLVLVATELEGVSVVATYRYDDALRVMARARARPVTPSRWQVDIRAIRPGSGDRIRRRRMVEATKVVS